MVNTVTHCGYKIAKIVPFSKYLQPNMYTCMLAVRFRQGSISRTAFVSVRQDFLAYRITPS